MPCATDDLSLSFAVLNWTRRYADGLRELIEEKIIAKLRAEDRKTATLDDVQSCVSAAFTEYSAQMRECPAPDLATVNQAISELDAGNYQDVREIRNELRSAMSAQR